MSEPRVDPVDVLPPPEPRSVWQLRLDAYQAADDANQEEGRPPRSKATGGPRPGGAE